MKEIKNDSLPDKEISLEDAFYGALQGDEHYFLQLDRHLRGRISRYFSKRAQSEAEDLTQEALYKIFSRLDSFSPKQASFTRSFLGWCYGVARNIYRREIRQSIRRRQAIRISKPKTFESEERSDDEVLSRHVNIHSEDYNKQSPQPIDLTPGLQAKVVEVLPPSLTRVVSLSLGGKDEVEIATELELSRLSVRAYLVKARKLIEEQIILPTGYKRLSSFDNATQAAIKRRGTAVKFLGVLYVTDEMVKEYHQSKRMADPELLEQGYSLLYQSTSTANYRTLLEDPKYQDLILIKNGRVYIKAKDLETFVSRKKLRAPEIKSPAPGYVPLSSFTKTPLEYERLRKAASQGKITAIKSGRFWFVTAESIEGYFNSSG